MVPAGGCFGSGVWLAESDLLGPSRKGLGTCPMSSQMLHHASIKPVYECSMQKSKWGRDGKEKKCLDYLVQAGVVWRTGHGGQVMVSSWMTSNESLACLGLICEV